MYPSNYALVVDGLGPSINNSVTNFSILKFFDIQMWPRKKVSYRQVIWRIFDIGWVKVDTNDVVRGYSSHVVCDDILKGSVENTLKDSHLTCYQ